MRIISSILKRRQQNGSWSSATFYYHIFDVKTACREQSKYLLNTSFPLHQDPSNQNLRLKSRKLAYLTTAKLIKNQNDSMGE